MKLFVLLLLIMGCSSSDIKRWGYRLQNIDKIEENEKKHTLWVIDYSYDGTDRRKISKNDIKVFHDHKSKVLAYFSIGEAEDYRFYFTTMDKSLLLEENTIWKGNFKVKYWDPRWYQIIDSYLERILKAGFDGVYLDIVDAFESLPNTKLAAKRMSHLVQHISKKSKLENPEFKVFIQNGQNIINFLDHKKLFVDSIDGVATEDLFFLGKSEMDNEYNPQKEVIEELKYYQNQRKVILSVEYLSDERKIKKYCKLAKELRFMPLIANRNLASKNTYCSN